MVLDTNGWGLSRKKNWVLGWLGTAGLAFPEWDKENINTELEHVSHWTGFCSQGVNIECLSGLVCFCFALLFFGGSSVLGVLSSARKGPF